MKHDELRRLAIRMAIHKDRGADICGECGKPVMVAGAVLDHGPGCPIAELEAEEDAHEQP